MNEEGWEDLSYIVEDGSEIKASILILKSGYLFRWMYIICSPGALLLILKIYQLSIFF